MPKDNIPAMNSLPPAHQDAIIARYDVRRDVQLSIKDLAKVLSQWVRDSDPLYAVFYEEGHYNYYHELTDMSLTRQLGEIGLTDEAIHAAIQRKDTPLNYMGADELRYVYLRIRRMIDYFIAHPQGGSFDDAVDAYRTLAGFIRAEVIRATGHTPEEYAVEALRLTGAEDPKRFKVAPYRAPLFSSEDA